MKKVGLFIILCIFLISFISADPPVTQVQQFTEGYVIEIPQDNVLKLNTDYYFEFHVFNISSGYPMTSGIGCTFHLYDNKGIHIYNQTNSITLVDYDYFFNVSGSNFSKVGTYYYHVQCNSSTLGGYASSSLIVTPNGIILENSESTLYIILFSIFFIIFSVLTYFAITLKYSNEKTFERGEIFVTKVTKTKYIKLFCILIAYMCFVWILTMLSGVVNNFISLIGLKDMIINSYIFFNTLSLPVLIFILLLTFIEIWRDILFNKQLLKFGKAIITGK